MLKSSEQLAELPDDSTEIFAPNLIEYYKARPQNLSDISLFYFASWYDKVPPLKHHNSTTYLYCSIRCLVQKTSETYCNTLPQFFLKY